MHTHTDTHTHTHSLTHTYTRTHIHTYNHFHSLFNQSPPPSVVPFDVLFLHLCRTFQPFLLHLLSPMILLSSLSHSFLPSIEFHFVLLYFILLYFTPLHLISFQFIFYIEAFSILYCILPYYYIKHQIIYNYHQFKIINDFLKH